MNLFSLQTRLLSISRFQESHVKWQYAEYDNKRIKLNKAKSSNKWWIENVGLEEMQISGVLGFMYYN